MKKAFVLLSLALVFFCSTGFAQIQWAGTPIIHLDAMDLTEGDATTWTNKVGVGGDYTVVQGIPTVDSIEEGITGARKMVSFHAADLAVEACDAMKWENGAPASITAGSNFSMEVWARFTSTHPWNLISSIGNRGSVSYSIGITQTQEPYHVSNGVPLQWPLLPETGKFMHLVTTYNGGTDEHNFYIDGVLVDTDTDTSDLPTGADVTVGGYWRTAPDGYYYGYGGGLAMLRIHDDVMTGPQVLNNYEEEKDNFQAPGANLAQVAPYYKGGLGFGEVSSPDTKVVDFVFKNDSLAVMTLSDISVTGSSAFSVDSPDLSELTAGATRTVSVTFTPTDDTEQLGQLVIASNAASSPDSFSLAGNVDPIYVDQATGDDGTGDGSVGSPYASIAKAAEMVYPSGSISVGPGSYSGLGSADVRSLYASLVAPSRATIETPEQWTFSLGGEIMSFEGFDFVAHVLLRSLFLLEGEQPVVLNMTDCTFDYADDEFLGGGGSLVQATGADTQNTITLEDCVVTFPFVTEVKGIFVSASAPSAVTITDCVVNGGQRAVNVSSEGTTLTIDGLTVDEVSQPAVEIGGQEIPVSISRTRIDSASDGIVCNSNGVVQIVNCIIDGGQTDITLGNNDENVPTVYHCTLVGSDDSPSTTGIQVNGGTADISNCIVLGYTTAIGGGGTNIGGANITDGAADNPLFVYQSGGAFARPATRGGNDLHITNGSAAIAAGKPSYITDDFEGFLRDVQTPDIGAYELEGGVPPTVAPPATGVDDWALFE